MTFLQFRRQFDQYVNLRPVRLIPGVKSPLALRNPGSDKMCVQISNAEVNSLILICGSSDFWVVRENTEGTRSRVYPLKISSIVWFRRIFWSWRKVCCFYGTPFPPLIHSLPGCSLGRTVNLSHNRRLWLESALIGFLIMPSILHRVDQESY